MDQQETMDK
jgi:hypothetical protein